MFKVVRDLVTQPKFLVLCDRACGRFAVGDVPPGPPQNEDAHQALWARALLEQGWKITLSEQICPEHMKLEKESESRIVVVPSMAAASKRN